MKPRLTMVEKDNDSKDMCRCGILKRNIVNRKTALEQLEYWIEQYYRINGTPTLDDIKSQINLLKDYEREQLHIAHVVWRSEQLKAYAEFLQTRRDFQERSNKDLAIDYCDSL